MIFRCLRSVFRVCNLKMSCASNTVFLPHDVRGMKELEREKFTRIIKVAMVTLSSYKVSEIMHVLKPYLIKLQYFKSVQFLDEDNPSASPTTYKCVLFHPQLIMHWTDFTEQERKVFNDHDVTEANFSHKEIKVTYKNFSYEEIFKAVLPVDQEIVSGFSQIGHIIHVNLRDHLLPYKSLIGAVLLDKVKKCRTVVNKTGTIDTTFRNFSMELIAGYEDYIVTVKEHNCIFEFDFSKVYWNPRLGIEHGRVMECIDNGDVLFDIFCGVGPFVVPASKKLCTIFANDLNPDSFFWLNHNIMKNKVSSPYVQTFNLDAKDFICTIFKNFLEDCCTGKQVLDTDTTIHVTMNLPKTAVQFLKYFNGLLDNKELYDNFNWNVIVYVYCFCVGENVLEIAKQLVIENIQRDISSDILDSFDVRNVSPKKDMIKVTFKLTKETLFGLSNDADSSQPVAKKRRIESDVTI